MKKHLFENLGNLGKLYDIHLDVCIFFRWVGENHELVSVFQVPDVSDVFFLQDFFS